MNTYSPAVIAKAEADLRALGMEYKYENGAWVTLGGTPVAPENAAQFTAMLDELQAAVDAGEIRLRAPRRTTPPVAPQSPAAPPQAPPPPPPAVVPPITGTAPSAPAFRFADDAPLTPTPSPQIPNDPATPTGAGRWRMPGSPLFVPAGTPGAVFMPFAAQAPQPGQPTPQSPAAPPQAPPAPASMFGRARNYASNTARTVGAQASQMLGGLAPALTVGAAAYNVHSGANEGERAARAVVDGAGSLISDATRAGLKIGGALLGAAMSPFGASGAAVSGLASSVGDTVTSAIQGGFKLLSNVAGAGGRAIGGAVGLGLGVGGAVAGGALGMAAGPVGILPGAMIGGLVGTAAGLVAMKIASAVAESVGGIVGAIGAAANEAASLATEGFKATVAIIKDLSAETDKWAARVATISAQTGLSTNRAAASSLAFGSVGLGGTLGSIAGAPGNNPTFYGMRAALWRLPSYSDPMAPAAFASRYQQMQRGGPLGQMMAGMMSKDMGYDTPEGMRVSQIAPQKLVAQIGFAQKLQGDLGLDPQKIKLLGDEIYLLSNKAGSAVSLIKLAVAQAALPSLQAFAAYVSAHGDEIVAGIKKGVNWLIHDAPVLLMRGAEIGLHALSSFAGGIATFSDNLLSNLPAILDGVTVFVNGLREVGILAAGIGGGLLQVAKNGADVMATGTPSSATNAAPSATTPQEAPPAAPPTVTRQEISEAATRRDPYAERVNPDTVKQGGFGELIPLAVKLAPEILPAAGRALKAIGGGAAKMVGRGAGAVAKEVGKKAVGIVTNVGLGAGAVALGGKYLNDRYGDPLGKVQRVISGDPDYQPQPGAGFLPVAGRGFSQAVGDSMTQARGLFAPVDLNRDYGAKIGEGVKWVKAESEAVQKWFDAREKDVHGYRESYQRFSDGVGRGGDAPKSQTQTQADNQKSLLQAMLDVRQLLADIKGQRVPGMHISDVLNHMGDALTNDTTMAILSGPGMGD